MITAPGCLFRFALNSGFFWSQNAAINEILKFFSTYFRGLMSSWMWDWHDGAKQGVGQCNECTIFPANYFQATEEKWKQFLTHVLLLSNRPFFIHDDAGRVVSTQSHHQPLLIQLAIARSHLFSSSGRVFIKKTIWHCRKRLSSRYWPEYHVRETPRCRG